MKVKYIYSLLITTLYCCDFGPPALNEDFVSCNNINKKVKFKNLIANYKLDKDSKKKIGITDSLDFYLELGINEKRYFFNC